MKNENLEKLLLSIELEEELDGFVVLNDDQASDLYGGCWNLICWTNPESNPSCNSTPPFTHNCNFNCY